MALGLDTLGDAASDLAGAFGKGAGTTSPDKIYSDALTAGLFSGTGVKVGPDGSAVVNSIVPWHIDGTDWYKVFSYQFVVKVEQETFGPPASLASPTSTSFGALANAYGGGLGNAFGDKGLGSLDSAPKSDAQELIYALPIPPQALTIRMIPASQATATMGGVVEETGANVFWLINMSGTTGTAVSRRTDGGTKRHEVAKQFRDSITTTGLMAGSLAGVNSIISKTGGIADSVLGGIQSASQSQNPLDVVNGLVGAANTALLPPLPYAGSAVDKETNGYTEMMELHRFLYTYSALKGANPNKYSLVFRSFKTNQEWRCVVQDFQIQQNAQSPMLYKYNISLKCWNVRPPGNRDNAEFDRFGANGDLKSVSTIDPIQMTKLYQSLLQKGNSVNILTGA